MNRTFIGCWKRFMPEEENGMLTSVTEKFTFQMAPLACLRRARAVASNSCRPECRAKDASRANYVVAAVRKSTAEIRNNKSVSGKSDGAEMMINFFKAAL